MRCCSAVVPENSIRSDSRGEAESAHHPMRCLRSSTYLGRMSPTCSSRGAGLKSRTFFCHQLNIALRRRPPRLRLRGSDRALLVLMTRLWPSLLGLARVVKPATILRWHRAGFRTYWRWKSRGRAGRPRIGRELRDLIRRMNNESRTHLSLDKDAPLHRAVQRCGTIVATPNSVWAASLVRADMIFGKDRARWSSSQAQSRTESGMFHKPRSANETEMKLVN
jgi:hypothetical protein